MRITLRVSLFSTILTTGSGGLASPRGGEIKPDLEKLETVKFPDVTSTVKSESICETSGTVLSKPIYRYSINPYTSEHHIMSRIDPEDGVATRKCSELQTEFGGSDQLTDTQRMKALNVLIWLISKYYKVRQDEAMTEIISDVYEIDGSLNVEAYKREMATFMKNPCPPPNPGESCIDDDTRWRLVEAFGTKPYKEMKCMNVLGDMHYLKREWDLRYLQHYADADETCSRDGYSGKQKFAYLAVKALHSFLHVSQERIHQLSCDPLTTSTEDDKLLDDCLDKMDILFEVLPAQVGGHGFTNKPFTQAEQRVMIPRFLEAYVEYSKPKDEYQPENVLRAIGFPESDLIKARNRYDRGTWELSLGYRLLYDEDQRREMTKRIVYFDFLVCDAYYLLKKPTGWNSNDLTNSNCRYYAESTSKQSKIFLVQWHSDYDSKNLRSICERPDGAMNMRLSQMIGETDLMAHVDLFDTYANEMCTALNKREEKKTNLRSESELEKLESDKMTALIWLITKYSKYNVLKGSVKAYGKILGQVCRLLGIPATLMEKEKMDKWLALMLPTCLTPTADVPCLDDGERFTKAGEFAKVLATMRPAGHSS